MIKTVMCIRRKPGLTREAFEHHWKHVHAPLIMRLKDDLRILRYVQSNANEEIVSEVLRQQRNGPAKFDGLGQAWFGSIQDLVEVASSPASAKALEALREDELKFIDLDNSPMFVVEEETVFDTLQGQTATPNAGGAMPAEILARALGRIGAAGGQGLPQQAVEGRGVDLVFLDPVIAHRAGRPPRRIVCRGDRGVIGRGGAAAAAAWFRPAAPRARRCRTSASG